MPNEQSNLVLRLFDPRIQKGSRNYVERKSVSLQGNRKSIQPISERERIGRK